VLRIKEGWRNGAISAIIHHYANEDDIDNWHRALTICRRNMPIP
jgi:hypothetical protein